MENIIGQKIVEVRPMTSEEKEDEGWEYGTVVIVLNNGVLLYSSSDEEGNDAGVMFGKKGDTPFVLRI